MKKYIIIKTSRPTSDTPYRGSSCERAGVLSGKIYESKEEAEKDAEKLSKVNPVGFVVKQLDR